MSSAPPGRYQSRLFNFLNRQSIQLTERLERAVRHLKVAAVWGAQILVYPVYLLVQASLSAGRQISATAEAGWPQIKEFTTKEHPEKPPTADTPIQRVLSEVNTLELQVERLKVGSLSAQHQRLSEDVNQLEIFNPSSNLQLTASSHPQPVNQIHLSQSAPESSEEHQVIQGVASLLATRTLVLITVHNEILDILTPQEQQKLASRISWEVADLLRQRRIAQTLDSNKATRRFATLDQPRVFLPVRLFWQVMAWVQTSPVAIAANLFQESTLVYRSELNDSQLRLESSNFQRFNLPGSSLAASNNHGELNVKGSNFQPSNLAYPSLQEELGATGSLLRNGNAFGEQPSNLGQGALAFLDRTFAELESHQLVPGSEVVIAWSERAKRTLGERTQKLLKPLQTQFTKPGDPNISSEVSQTNTVGIQALIYAAIDYFFGRHSSNLPGTGSQEHSAVLANSQEETPQLPGRQAAAKLPGALPSGIEVATTSESKPWLTWGDLFGRPDASSKPQNSQVQISNDENQGQLPEAFNSKTPIRPGNSVLGVIKRYLSLKPPPGKLSTPSAGESVVERSESVVQSAKSIKTTRLQPRPTQGSPKGNASKKRKTLSSTGVSSRSTSVSPAKSTTGAITTSASDTHLEAAPDWIETPATPAGYVKHPLERLLESVDLAMLWLEDLAVKVWRWFQQIGRRG